MKINNLFSEHPSLWTRIQHTAEEIAHTPLTQAKYTQLRDELDSTLSTINALKGRVNNLFLEKAREKIIPLYGQLETGWMERRITLIKEGAQHLQQTRNQAEAHLLQEEIQAFEKECCASVEGRKVISLAKTLASKILSPSHHTSLPLFLANQLSPVFLEEVSEEVEEIFGVAELLYKGELSHARSLYNRFSESTKGRFTLHMKNLKERPFSSELETLQALMATAYELSGTAQDSYLSEEEIATFFSELAQVKKQEDLQ